MSLKPTALMCEEKARREGNLSNNYGTAESEDNEGRI